MANNTFNHPFPTDQSVYPYNNVTQTRSGHIFEIDDTLGNERIHEKHKSGTSRIIDAEGKLSVMVVSNRYTTICGEDFVTIMGDANITVNGSANLTVNGNYNVEVNGNMNQTVKGEYRLKVGAAYKNEVLGDKAENIAGKKDSIVGNGVNNTVRGGGIKNMVVGSIEETVAGGYTGIYTGSSSTTALLGASMTAPAGAATIGGMTAAIDGVSMLTLTSLGPTMMYSTVTNMTTPLVNVLGGALIAAGDVRALGGTTGLATHIHLGDGTGSAPAPTAPGIG
jgi:hypothetical protein